MPRTYMMNFDAPGLRWRKTFKGEKYEVYLRDLDLARDQWTERGSYQAANDWWTNKLAEIQASLTHRVKEHVRKTMGDPKDLPPNLQFHLTNEIAKAEHREAEAAKKPKFNTVGMALDSWLAIMRVNAEASSVVSLVTYVEAFKEITDKDGNPVITADMPVAFIDGATVEKVFLALDALPVAAATKRKKFITWKTWLRYAANKYQFSVPQNLDWKGFGWKVKTVSKELPPINDILTFVNELPDRLKLYVLLAWNTGMNNVDIASLSLRQIDLDAQTLRRKRVKTEGWDRVPTVVYYLWNETARLLRQEMNDTPGPILTDSKGEPLYVTSKDGSGSVYDKIKSTWRDTLGRSSERPYTLKDFRDFGSMMIQNSKFRTYQAAWLGHAPATVAERNYSGEEDVREACQWMETQLWPT